jgi:hypothetical protein
MSIPDFSSDDEIPLRKGKETRCQLKEGNSDGSWCCGSKINDED